MNTGKFNANLKIPPPGWLVPVLLPLAGLYRLLVWVRLLAYRTGWLRTRRAACPVIAVGNLSVGGSGKTPMVDYLLGESAHAGKKTVSISRGYGRRGASALLRLRSDEGWPAFPGAIGDEPAMLALRHPGVAVYAGAHRVAAARLALAWDGPDLIVLDDAYQHLRIARDLNVLLVDARQGLGNGRVLPLGPLREPIAAVGRADAVLITKADGVDVEDLRARLRSLLPPEVPLFVSDYRPRRLRLADGSAEFSPEVLAGREISLLCGIAQPDGFARTVEGLGARIARQWNFPDHHRYGPDDLERLDRELGTDAPTGEDSHRPPSWVTTEKDAVKISGRLKNQMRLGVLEMALEPEPAARAFFFDFIEQCGIK